MKAPEEEIDKVNKEISGVVGEIENLRKVKKHLKDPEKKPFVWEIDFAEIFGDKGGFDIVIGNPPYVRHQKISPPNRLKAEVTLKDRKGYKDQLINSVKAHIPVMRSLDRRSDYYIYFYFHGLSILNTKGTFCFITSNSWLDAGYGKDLQEFLLKYVPIVGIYDNEAKRTFVHADVNTIIALFGAPQLNRHAIPDLIVQGRKPWAELTNKARFVMFKKPFEEVVSAKNLSEIENTNRVLKTESFRVYPSTQRDLLEDGWEYPEGFSWEDSGFAQGFYGGNNLGGKYLRAPDIFFTLLEKGEDNLVELRNISSVETYLNTGGADDFFFLKTIKANERLCLMRNLKFNQDFDIEHKYLNALIESPRELNSVVVKKGNLTTKLLAIDPKSKQSDIKKEKVWQYIKWGVEKGFHRKSGRKGRKCWYILPEQAYHGNEIIIPCRIGDRHAVFFNKDKAISHRFYRLTSLQDGIEVESMVLSLNSTVTFLSMELFRNPALGEGVLDLGKPGIRKFVLVHPRFFKDRIDKFRAFLHREIRPIFEECGIDPNKPIREQEPKPLPDRKELDDIVFGVLGLTEQERKEVYWAVCELVKERLEKARSLKKKK